MLLEELTQTFNVTRIEQIHSSSKRHVFNTLMVLDLKIVCGGWLLDMSLQSRPARKPALPRNRQLRVAQPQLCFEDLVIGGFLKLRMELPEPLRDLRIARRMRHEQILRLILEMVEIRVRWKTFNRHDELPFFKTPDVRIYRQKVSSKVELS